jgi:predicted unusual protein kinase regulating ubiquinone biosynthesis (AarF/ABC1/UbiB family)
MTFIEGQNLGKIAEFKDKAFYGNSMPKFVKDRFATTILDILARAWGEQIFVLNMFNADPHPGIIIYK